VPAIVQGKLEHLLMQSISEFIGPKL